MNETEYLKQGANGKRLKESIKQLNMENEIKEIERLFIIHDDLDDKKKKIERLIKENFETTIDLEEQKRRYEKRIEGNLEVIKGLTKKTKVMEKEVCESCDNTGLNGYDRCDPPAQYICEDCDSYLLNNQKHRENKDYLKSKDLTWKDSPMTLNQVYDIAKGTTLFGEFKAEIDRYYNGTPETVVDLSEYVLTKKQ